MSYFIVLIQIPKIPIIKKQIRQKQIRGDDEHFKQLVFDIGKIGVIKKIVFNKLNLFCIQDTLGKVIDYHDGYGLLKNLLTNLKFPETHFYFY